MIYPSPRKIIIGIIESIIIIAVIAIFLNIFDIFVFYDTTMEFDEETREFFKREYEELVEQGVVTKPELLD